MQFYYLDTRLISAALESVVVHSGMECILKCLRNDCCRSTNYKKKRCNESEPNCELLHSLASERKDNLESNEAYDHYILLQPETVRVRI